MKVVVQRREGLAHDVEIGGHALVTDEPESKGGADNGPSPTALLAASLGSCALTTIEMYADRKGWDLGAASAEVEYDMAAPGEPARFELSVSIPAELEEEQLQRIEKIARKCPVHRALAGEAVIEDRIRAGTGS